MERLSGSRRDGVLRAPRVFTVWAPASAPRPLPLLDAERAAVQDDAWFSSLDPAAQDALLERCAVRRIAAGSLVCTQGGAAEAWYGVAAGAMKLKRVDSSGRETVLDLMPPGTWFGAGALLAGDALPYGAEAVAPTTLLEMPRHSLEELVAREPSLRGALARLDWLRAAQVMRRFHDLMQPTLERRVRVQLSALAAQFGTVETDGVRIKMPLDQSALAVMVRSSRQRINALLSTFEQLGIVAKARGAAFGVKILQDPAAELDTSKARTTRIRSARNQR